eukprot:GHVS01002427.1.p1 GENE.GHVS01002427.1~~GHVS01002427.1.p1  ORF type:complete len:226 (-),score=20.69 GHVS01002427.1:234-911(-)
MLRTSKFVCGLEEKTQTSISNVVHRFLNVTPPPPPPPPLFSDERSPTIKLIWMQELPKIPGIKNHDIIPNTDVRNTDSTVVCDVRHGIRAIKHVATGENTKHIKAIEFSSNMLFACGQKKLLLAMANGRELEILYFDNIHDLEPISWPAPVKVIVVPPMTSAIKTVIRLSSKGHNSDIFLTYYQAWGRYDLRDIKVELKISSKRETVETRPSEMTTSPLRLRNTG